MIDINAFSPVESKQTVETALFSRGVFGNPSSRWENFFKLNELRCVTDDVDIDTLNEETKEEVKQLKDTIELENKKWDKDSVEETPRGTETTFKDKHQEKQNQNENPPQKRKQERTFSEGANSDKIKNIKEKNKPDYGETKKKSIAPFFVITAVVLGIFVGLQANSYYIFKDSKVTGFSAAFSWLLEPNMPFSFTPFNTNVFFIGFLVGLSAVALVGLFVYLNNDAKKLSRVGHEHGNAHLATKSDFANYQSKFMQMPTQKECEKLPHIAFPPELFEQEQDKIVKKVKK